MIHTPHSLVSILFHVLAGGILGLVTSSYALQFGWRSADRLPGDSRWPHCLWCLKPFTWQETFPFFGWILRPDSLLMPCPCGSRKNLWQQPTVELLGFIFGAFSFYCGGWSASALPLVFGLCLLPAMALVDLHFGVIPDGLNILLGLFGFWYAICVSEIYAQLVILAAFLSVGIFCALFYSRWRGKEMLGLGDVKFLAAAGLWLQPEVAPWFLAVAGGIGIVIGFLWQRAGAGKEFPFAPALCASLALCIFYQMTQLL